VARSEASEEEFLKSIDVSIKGQAVTDETSAVFTRCFELINKTNQFNTTGRRWTQAELVDLLKHGGFLLALDVRDRYTGYGITCVAVVRDEVLEQVVMSCRVFGLGVERTCLALAIREIKKRGFAKIKGRLNDTGKNALSLRYFEEAGFWYLESENVWIAPVTGVSIPEHVSVDSVTAEPVG
jgi:FkbH-like protein